MTDTDILSITTKGITPPPDESLYSLNPRNIEDKDELAILYRKKSNFPNFTEEGDNSPIIVPVSSFSKYDEGLLLKRGDTESNINKYRASQQGAWDEFGNFFNQAIVGQAIGGTVQAVGGLLELPKTLGIGIGNLLGITKKQADFSNILTDWGQDIINWTEDVTPIYRKNPEKSFDFKDSGYWFSMLPSVVSTVSLMLPGIGMSKGLGAVSKFMRTLSEIKNLEKISKLEKLGKNTAKVIADATNMDNYWLKVSTMNGASTIGENYMETAQVGKDTKDYIMNMDDKQFDDFVNSPEGNKVKEGIFGKPQTSIEGKPINSIVTKEQVADYVASQAMWKNFGLNAPGLLFTLPEFAVLAKGKKLLTTNTLGLISKKVAKAQVASKLGNTATEELINAGVKELRPLGKKILYGLKMPSQFLLENLGEGAQEMTQAIAQSDAMHYGKYLLGEEPASDFGDRVSEYLHDPSTWEQGFWGALGGIAFSGTSRGINRLKNAINDTEDDHASLAKIHEIQGRERTMATYGASLAAINNNKNIFAAKRNEDGTITTPDFTGTPEEIEEQKSNALDAATLPLWNDLGQKFARNGNVDFGMDWIDSKGFAESMVNSGIVDNEEEVKTKIPEIKKQIMSSVEAYKDAYSRIFSKTMENEQVREILLGKVVNNKTEIDYRNNQNVKLQNEIAKLKSEDNYLTVLADNDVVTNPDGTIQKKDVEGSIHNFVLNEVTKILNNHIQSVSNPTTKDYYDAQKTKIESQINSYKKDIPSNLQIDVLNSGINSKILDKQIELEINKLAIGEKALANNEIFTKTKEAFKKEKTGLDTKAAIEVGRQTKEYLNYLNTTHPIATNATSAEYSEQIKNLNDEIRKVNKGDATFFEPDPTYNVIYPNSKPKILEVLKTRINQAKNLQQLAKNKEVTVEKINEVNNKVKEIAKPAIPINFNLEYNPVEVSKKPTSKQIDKQTATEIKIAVDKAFANNPTTEGFNPLISKEKAIHTVLSDLDNTISEWQKEEPTTNFTPYKQFAVNSVLEKYGYVTPKVTSVKTKPIIKENDIINAANTFEQKTQNATIGEKENSVKPQEAVIVEPNQYTTKDLNHAVDFVNTIIGDYEKTNNKTLNKIVSFKTLSGHIAKSISEEDANKVYPLFKKAYKLFLIQNDGKYKVTSLKEVDKLTLQDIYDKYGKPELLTPTIPTFEESSIINKTGGSNVVNLYLPTLDITLQTRTEQGDLEVSNKTGEELNTIFDVVKPGNKVIIKINTELSGAKGYELNKDNKKTIPIKITTEDGTLIGALNTLPSIHNGVEYQFEGNDWVDFLNDDYNLDRLKELFPALLDWYRLHTKQSFTTKEEEDALEKILISDSTNLLNELLNRHEEGNKVTYTGKNGSLQHILNVIFFGENVQFNPNLEFNKDKVKNNLLNWKDKLLRDNVNTIAIRNKLGTNPNATIISKIAYKSNGDIINSVDKYGNKIYRNLLDTIEDSVDKIKLFGIDKDSDGTKLIDLEDSSNTMSFEKKLGNNYSFSLFTPIKSAGFDNNGNPVYIPTTIETNELGHSKKENNEFSTKVVNFISDKIEELIILQRANNSSNNEKIDNIVKQLNELTEVNYNSKNKNPNLLTINKDNIEFTYTEKGNAHKLIYWFNTKNNNLVIDGERVNNVEKELKNALSNLRHNVVYNNFKFAKYTDVFSKTYNSYKEYLISTDTILTSVGKMVDEKGNKIGNITSKTANNVNGQPLIINIDTSNLSTIVSTENKVISKEPQSEFRNFVETQGLTSNYEPVFKIFDELLNSGYKFNPNLSEEEANKYGATGFGAYISDTEEYRKVGLAKTIVLTKKWSELNTEQKTKVLAHEIIHAYIKEQYKDNYKELISQLDDFYNSLLETVEAKENTNPIIKDIFDAIGKDKEELVTYALTNKTFATFLDSIKSDNTKESTSFWKQLKDIIRDIFKPLFGTKLDELNTILDSILPIGETIKLENNPNLSTGNKFDDIQMSVVSDFVPTSQTIALEKQFGYRNQLGAYRPYDNQDKRVIAIKRFNDWASTKNISLFAGAIHFYNKETGVEHDGIKIAYKEKLIVDNSANIQTSLQLASISDTNEVNYQLKSVSILLSDKAKQIFSKGEKVGWSIDKILTEIQIPKEQKQLILDLGITDREQLTLELASKYSYSVEVNTAKEKREDENAVKYEGFLYKKENGNIYARKDYWNTDWVLFENAKYVLEGTGVLEKLDSKTESFPSQHYSNLTVPGGTNYTENEISTPLITPSIKGHAKFSTDNGIGWFRSDDKDIRKNVIKDGDLYFEEIEGVGMSEISKKEYENTRIDKTKTRRILEVQSDLFQKGRDKESLTYVSLETPSLHELEHGIGKFVEERNDLKGNQFLQLLNKDNNWVTFFIKSIIQDSAKNGYEKVLFPKGETAAKVEGHETLANEINSINENIVKLESYKPVIGDTTPDYMIQGGIKIQDANDLDLVNKAIQSEIDTLNNRKKELKSDGIEKLKPIEAFYEIKITNVLNKLGTVKEITDEYGNKWNEVDLSDSKIQQVISPIQLASIIEELPFKNNIEIQDNISDEDVLERINQCK